MNLEDDIKPDNKKSDNIKQPDVHKNLNNLSNLERWYKSQE